MELQPPHPLYLAHRRTRRAHELINDVRVELERWGDAQDLRDTSATDPPRQLARSSARTSAIVRIARSHVPARPQVW